MNPFVHNSLTNEHELSVYYANKGTIYFDTNIRRRIQIEIYMQSFW